MDTNRNISTDSKSVEQQLEESLVRVDPPADNETARAIAALKEQLEYSDFCGMVDMSGTVLNPTEPMSASSLANWDEFKPILA